MSAPSVTLLDHPVIQTRLTLLRDAETPHHLFRAILEEVAALMVYEVTRDLPTAPAPVRTPLETTEGRKLARTVTVVPILRAGLAMAGGVLRLLPEARLGHLGLHRDEKTLEAHTYYCKLPRDLADSDVLLVDPMLATGGSATAAATHLRQAGASAMKLVCLVAAPEGIAAFHTAHPSIPIVTAAIDRQLDHRGYILPGLGDAGDRICGT